MVDVAGAGAGWWGFGQRGWDARCIGALAAAHGRVAGSHGYTWHLRLSGAAQWGRRGHGRQGATAGRTVLSQAGR